MCAPFVICSSQNVWPALVFLIVNESRVGIVIRYQLLLFRKTGFSRKIYIHESVQVPENVRSYIAKY